MYGQTEATARLSYMEPSRLPEKLGSIGKAIPGVELRVVDQDGNPMEDGVEGELVARGGNIMKGYYQDGEETSKTLKDGWTVVTKDGQPSAHFEHSVAITKDKPEILTEEHG